MEGNKEKFESLDKMVKRMSIELNVSEEKVIEVIKEWVEKLNKGEMSK